MGNLGTTNSCLLTPTSRLTYLMTLNKLFMLQFTLSVKGVSVHPSLESCNEYFYSASSADVQ